MSPTPAPRVLVFTASVRTASLNARLATAIDRALTGAGAHTRLENLRDFDVPLYDGDLQDRHGVPEAAHRLADMLRDHDATVIVSPEYNYSMPGNLKNLIDWLSRIKPWPTIGVNGMLASASPGAVGGHRGLLALRVPLEGLGARLFPRMFTLAHADTAFDDDGGLAQAAQRQSLHDLVAEFLTVVAATTAHRVTATT